MSIAVYPGTFDPFTFGHFDLIQRASQLFDTLIVAISTHPQKQPFFSLFERIDLGERLCATLPKVSVKSFSGLLVDFMRAEGASVVIRGVRTSLDLDLEWQLARMNRHLLPGLETILMLPSEPYIHISSTLVKEVGCLGGKIDSLVPPVVLEAFHAKQGRI